MGQLLIVISVSQKIRDRLCDQEACPDGCHTFTLTDSVREHLSDLQTCMMYALGVIQNGKRLLHESTERIQGKEKSAQLASPFAVRLLLTRPADAL